MAGVSGVLMRFIISVAGRVGWVGLVARIGEIKNTPKILGWKK